MLHCSLLLRNVSRFIPRVSGAFSELILVLLALIPLETFPDVLDIPGHAAENNGSPHYELSCIFSNIIIIMHVCCRGNRSVIMLEKKMDVHANYDN